MADVEPPTAGQDELNDVVQPVQTSADDRPRPRATVATPENDNDDGGYAAAAAEVAAMNPNIDPANLGRQQRPTASGQQQQQRERDTTAAEQAVMGAATEGVGGFEIIDESGELVKGRFLIFLQEYRERIVVPQQTTDPNDSDYDEEDEDHVQYYYPYAEQAAQIAQRQLRRRSSSDDEEDDDGHGGGVFSNTLFVDFSHLLVQDEELAEAIQNDAVRFEPFLQRASKTFVLDLHPELDVPDGGSGGAAGSTTYFVAFHNLPTTLPVRHLRTDRIGRLSAVTGTITRTSEVRPELLVASFRCTKCGLLAEHIRQQYHYTRPTLCRNPRCQNRSSTEFTLEIPKSEFCDWQKLRVQENSEEIPPGSMPRSMDIVVRNEMVERAKAGDKCVFIGSLVVIPDGSALARAGEAPRSTPAGMRRGGNNNETAMGGGGGVRGLKALGVRELTYRTCFVASCVLEMDAVARLAQQRSHPNQGGGSGGPPQPQQNPTASAMASVLFGPASHNLNEDPTAQEVAMEFTESEREDIRNMKSSARLYQQMVQSIAPGTFGHAEVKRGILLMLLGGVHKTTSEGMKLRGDINVCIVGDPSTAKSQFLKYVHAFLPSRAIYTSGKASSAAGLTAAVQRDQDTGEYCIEAGALMLADNGICCIDEFDKMDPTDQVAIHEAMEQQTISITKAGIQATLNARASILAAANPIYGRYDRTKTLKANVALSAPILSRFDLFFVVLDECDEEADFKVAQHILNVHRCQEEAVRPPFTKEQMQRYIRFARTLNPKLTVESQRVLVDCYRKLRQGDTLGRSRTAYRITVRQLESMIRLSEALARLHCDDEIQPAYVREAFRLLKKSIIHVETEDVTFENEDDDDDDNDDDNNNNNNGESPMDVDEGNKDSQGQSQETSGNTEHHHPGEYNGETQDSGDVVSRGEDRPTTQPTGVTTDATGTEPNTASAAEEKPRPTKKRKKSKKKTQITFEQFEAISNAVATYLRSLEDDSDATSVVDEKDNDEGESGPPPTATKKKYVTWGEVVEWYLEQCEEQIGDSLQELERMRKLTNLVIRRLIDVDNILIRIGSSEAATSREEEQLTRIAVHPNYVVS